MAAPAALCLTFSRPCGLAYGGGDPNHIVNVPAGKMSAYPDDPDHLLRWLERHKKSGEGSKLASLGSKSFIPRNLYGTYLESVLEEATAAAIPSVGLVRIKGEVVDLSREIQIAPGSSRTAFAVQLEGGGMLSVDRVVLAWGNSAIPVQNDFTTDLHPDCVVGLLGTGLTMVDRVVSLHRQGHRGPIVALSRHSLLPTSHRHFQPIPPFLTADQAPTTVLGLWRLIRKMVALASREGQDWRAVVDALRPITQRLWEGLDRKERQRFLRHVAVVWDVHRHRIAQDHAHLLPERIEAGQLRVMAARLLQTDRDGDRLCLHIQRRGGKPRERLVVDRLLSCTGMHLDYSRTRQPLVQNLREQGLLTPDPLGLGLCGASNGKLLGKEGGRVKGLYTLGSPRKGDLWETTAVPELRIQAKELAAELLRSLNFNVLKFPAGRVRQEAG